MIEAIACLTMAIYFEARDEPIEGQYAIAEVVMNRVAHPRFPNTVCAVVREGYKPGNNLCQFSFYCDGKPEKMENEQAKRQAEAIARHALYDGQSMFVGDATFYRRHDVSWGSWANKLVEVGAVGEHVFFLLPPKPE